MSKTVRLQRFLSQAGLCSRREAEQWIADGRISLNGKRVQEQGVKVDPDNDLVKVDGKKIKSQKAQFILFHKPRGYLCNEDPKYADKSIYKLCPDLKAFAVAVGLEKTASGLILLSNDGQLHQAMTRQIKGIERKFEIRVKEKISDKTMARLKKGIHVDGQQVKLQSITWLREEKSYHWYVIRMRDLRDKSLAKCFKTAQHPLQKIIQTGFAGIEDSNLRKSCSRHLTPKEITHLKELLGFSLEK